MRLALVLVALAIGAPTPAQRHAIEQAFTGYVHMPGSPAAKDDKVVSVSVSRLDPRYAVARTQSKTAGPAVMLFHRSLGTWWVVEFGSDLGCDAAPRAVMDELKVGCSPPNGVAWINACGPMVWKPKSLILACADANYGPSASRGTPGGRRPRPRLASSVRTTASRTAPPAISTRIR